MDSSSLRMEKVQQHNRQATHSITNVGSSTRSSFLNRMKEAHPRHSVEVDKPTVEVTAAITANSSKQKIKVLHSRQQSSAGQGRLQSQQQVQDGEGLQGLQVSTRGVGMHKVSASTGLLGNDERHSDAEVVIGLGQGLVRKRLDFEAMEAMYGAAKAGKRMNGQPKGVNITQQAERQPNVGSPSKATMSAQRLNVTGVTKKERRPSLKLGPTQSQSWLDTQEVRRILERRGNPLHEGRPHSSIDRNLERARKLSISLGQAQANEGTHTLLRRRVELLGEEEAQIFADFPNIDDLRNSTLNKNGPLAARKHAKGVIRTPGYLKQTKVFQEKASSAKPVSASQSNSIVKTSRRGELKDPYMVFAMSDFAIQLAESKDLQAEISRRKRSPSPRSATARKPHKDTPEVVQQRRTEYLSFKEERTKLLIRRRELARERKEYEEMERTAEQLKHYKTVVWIRRVIRVMQTFAQIKKFLLLSRVRTARSQLSSKLEELNYVQKLIEEKVPKDQGRVIR